MNSITQIGIDEARTILGDKDEYEVIQFATFAAVPCKVNKDDLEKDFLAHGTDFVKFTSGHLFDDGIRVGFLLDDNAGRRFKVGIKG